MNCELAFVAPSVSLSETHGAENAGQPDASAHRAQMQNSLPSGSAITRQR
jgi:hypothetical protein